MPASDTYIEKDAAINEHIEQMRLSATKALPSNDAIVVASVSAIYVGVWCLFEDGNASRSGDRVGSDGSPTISRASVLAMK